MKMSGPCFIANENIVVQLDNDVNINATFSEKLTSSVTIHQEVSIDLARYEMGHDDVPRTGQLPPSSKQST